MAGHSHWHKIRFKKEIEAKKKGKIFSKIARKITIATKEGGKDPQTNLKLRQALEDAREFNMPKEKIEQAIKRGSGELKGERLEEFLFEALGPENSALIIEGITDNKNRALLDIKSVLQKYNGKIVESGSLRWQFEKKGVISLKKLDFPKEDLELKVIEAGAEDFRWPNQETLEIIVDLEKLEEVKNTLEAEGLEITSSAIEWIAKEEISLPEKEKQNCEKLIKKLLELEDVQEVYSNIKF